MYGSKFIHTPLQILEYKAARLLEQTESVPALDKLKLFAYDGHDT